MSLLDALNVNIVNNTIVVQQHDRLGRSRCSTRSGRRWPAPRTREQLLPTRWHVDGTDLAARRSAGLVSMQNSAVLTANLCRRLPVTCPAGHYSSSYREQRDLHGRYSYPLLYNNVIWQNASYYIGVGALQPAVPAERGLAVQRGLHRYARERTDRRQPDDHRGTASLARRATGISACAATRARPTTARQSRWLRTYSILDQHRSRTRRRRRTTAATNPGFISQYCNGSRQPPESGAVGLGRTRRAFRMRPCRTRSST